MDGNRLDSGASVGVDCRGHIPNPTTAHSAESPTLDLLPLRNRFASIREVLPLVRDTNRVAAKLGHGTVSANPIPASPAQPDAIAFTPSRDSSFTVKTRSAHGEFAVKLPCAHGPPHSVFAHSAGAKSQSSSQRHTGDMAQGSGEGGKRGRARVFGWWYSCIGLGFALLGLRYWIARASLYPVALRFVVAAGFVLLGVATLRSARQPARRPGNAPPQ